MSIGQKWRKVGLSRNCAKGLKGQWMKLFLVCGFRQGREMGHRL